MSTVTGPYTIPAGGQVVIPQPQAGGQLSQLILDNLSTYILKVTVGASVYFQAPLVEQKARDAARGVETGFRFRAVGVEKLHIDIRGRAAGAHHHHGVAADAEMPVRDGAGQRRRHGKGGVAGIEYDKVIAQAVHFHECGHGGWL